ncbi:ribokinase [Granulicella sp. L60]|uniref:ribokinase n=1 Tax=Granulicella sp. L60 TaxID=1641866 RepID=UPI00131CB3CB|nr:ribokinase [Granulicella sp. L60]
MSVNKSIVVVGSINLDLVASVDRMPAPGETIKSLGFATYSGGKGANQAVSVAKLGGPVVMIGRLGDDVFADRLLADLISHGIETDFIRKVPGPSGTAVIMKMPQGDNSIVVNTGANYRLLPEDIDLHDAEIGRASIILTQLEIPMSTVEYLGTLATSLNIPFVLDPAPACPLSSSLLRNVTWLTPNESETRILLRDTGMKLPDTFDVVAAGQAAAYLLGFGVRNVLLKLGSVGVYMEGVDVTATLIPAFSVTAVDTTAAGDSFNGAFAYALAVRGMAPVDAARFACSAAAISVTRIGAQPSIPTLKEVEEFLKT